MQGDTAVGSRAVRLTVAGLSVAALLLTTGCWVGLTAVNGVENQLTVDDSLSSQLASATPDTATTGAGATRAAEPQTFTAENILVVGSDTRTGQGPGFGSTADSSGNGKSDTAFILHISADRKSAFAVSIPRDSWVTRPGCKADGTTDGSMVTGKFNAAFGAGGRGCVLTAVKYLTHVPLTHFVEVDFNGFKAIVDALGGVTVCATRRLLDPIRPDGHGGMEGTDLDLPQGTTHIDGKTALRLARARHILGSTGSDLERIDHQQLFLKDLIQEASDSHLATDPIRLYDVLSQVAGSLTVDKGLSGDSLTTFVLSMASIKPSDITFYTVPWKPHPDGQDVLWVTSKADVMWNAMIHDATYPTASAKPSSSSTTSSSSSSSSSSAGKATCFS
jgi:LCP family protein required for cell wall assembly